MKLGLAPQLRRSAFTLLEVVLAIVIAVGLLTGVLLFYRQAASLRNQVFRQADQISAIRLLMDRMALELRTIPSSVGETARLLYGDSSSLHLLRTSVPSQSAWLGGPLSRASIAEADLVEVTYRQNTDTNHSGIFREELSFTPRTTLNTNLFAETESSLTPPTKSPAVTNTVSEIVQPLLTEEVHYLRFRYWNGSLRLDSWSAKEPPLGVEISIGIEANPNSDLTEPNTSSTEDQPEYPYELFRRVIALSTASNLPAISTAVPLEELLP